MYQVCPRCKKLSSLCTIVTFRGIRYCSPCSELLAIEVGQAYADTSKLGRWGES